MHLLRVGTGQVVHQSTQRGLVLILGAGVNDVGAVPEGLASLSDDALDMADG